MNPLLFLDYEGTLATSVERHYVQYVDALHHIRAQGSSLEQSLLEPLPKDEFLRRYAVVKKVGQTHFTGVGLESAQAQLNQLHSEIIWEYAPEHMLHECVFSGVLEALTELAKRWDLAMVSYTRQSQEDFAAHLQRLGIVHPGRLSAERVFTVGADGKSSREAKTESIVASFASRIAEEKQRGANPTYVGDAVDDFHTAVDAELRFIGVCTTGKSSHTDFQKAIQKAGLKQSAVGLFDTFADPACQAFLART